ncbi:hypothetical protein WIC93_06505 [Enterobacter cloacae]|uniref:hypothetical protein n=1 Tax=Enterobacter TaxID=547 RepID=UPI0013B053C3|nr:MULTISPECIES: hypothetical protein [Enterobacter]EKM5717659.1 hypothetical protein [Enterobacter cloacae]EKP1125278.1 hypothetical protein [Enterobacter cloacae]EKU2768716.1 hypothetical protein [Enterobacter cloacae]EKV7706158.1 hypothetical protein [Enterobacter cloacae]ELK7547833.1 hypothetical protein [Enterobacter cloacae]
MHLPKFGRVMNPVEAVKSGNFSDPFRSRYAVDVQLLDADGKPHAQQYESTDQRGSHP